MLLEILLTLEPVGVLAQLAGASQPADEGDYSILQPGGSYPQDGTGQVRIFLDALVIAEKRGDPGLFRVRKEETNRLLNPLEVKKVPVVVEGGTPPGGTAGR
jgi:hypothetical protein